MQADRSLAARRLGLTGVVLCVLALAAVSLPLPPSVSRLLASGVLHTLKVESRATAGPGTRLVDQIQRPDGTLEGKIIVPGTDDAEIESDLSIAVPPPTDLPVLVLSRTSGAGSEIFVAVFDGDRWGRAQAITSNTWNDFSPVAVCGPSGRVSVMWKAMPPASGTLAFYQSILDEKGATLLGPTRITLPAGTTDPGSGLPTNTLEGLAVLFAFDSGQKSPGPRIVCYGGSDEPIPVIRRVDFLLPAGTLTPEHVKIERVASSTVLFVKLPKAILYSVGSAAGWTPYASLDLDTLTEDNAELLIRQMVSNLAP